jgi:hypothetical protein
MGDTFEWLLVPDSGRNWGLHQAFDSEFLAKMVHRACKPIAASQVKESNMRSSPFKAGTLFAGVVAVLLAGCADLNDTALAAVSYKVQSYAIIDEQLVQGEMVLFPDHTGTITLRAEFPGGGAAPVTTAPRADGKPAKTSCVGRLRYTATTSGVVDLRCNDGAIADLRMALIGDTRGYGYGYTATGLASVAFGFTPVEARAHLTVPPGRQLLERTEGGGLELK